MSTHNNQHEQTHRLLEDLQRRYTILLSTEVNNFHFNPENMAVQIAEHGRFEKLYFTYVSLLWIVGLDTQCIAGRYDGRNEYSVKLGSKLVNEELGRNVLRLLELSDKTSLAYAEKAAHYWGTNHRTLQQSFSNLVFQWLKIAGHKVRRSDNLKTISDILESEPYKDLILCPLI